MRADDDLYALAERLGRVAMARGAMIATAESCTGGLVAAAITAVAGSSDWFDRGFVTYSNQAKIDELGVAPQTVARFGAVSVETAEEMAKGASQASRAQWAIAVTGVAGPSGGTPEKPVGTVCFAWVGPEGFGSEARHLQGDRAGIRREAVRVALSGLIDRMA